MLCHEAPWSRSETNALQGHTKTGSQNKWQKAIHWCNLRSCSGLHGEEAEEAAKPTAGPQAQRAAKVHEIQHRESGTQATVAAKTERATEVRVVEN